MPRALRTGFLVSAIVLAVNLLAAVLIGFGVGDAGVLDAVRTVLMWALVPPIAIALILIGALRHPVGRWHVAAALLCALGDGLGAISGATIVLLGMFLLGHIAFLGALWPTRKRSLAWSPAAIASPSHRSNMAVGSAARSGTSRPPRAYSSRSVERSMPPRVDPPQGCTMSRPRAVLRGTPSTKEWPHDRDPPRP